MADLANQISGKYDSDGNSPLDATAFTVTLSGTTVTLTSLVALEHSNAPQGVGEDNTLDLNGLINVVSTVTVTDGDNDVVSSQSASSGLSLTFDDTDPTLSITAAPTVGAAEVVEASGVGGQSQVTITPPTFTASAVDGFTTNVSYALALAGADGDRAADDGGQPSDHAGGRLGQPDLGPVRQRRRHRARCDGVHGDAVWHDGDADVVGCP